MAGVDNKSLQMMTAMISICVLSITFSLTAPLLSQELRHETDKDDFSETGVRKI